MFKREINKEEKCDKSKCEGCEVKELCDAFNKNIGKIEIGIAKIDLIKKVNRNHVREIIRRSREKECKGLFISYDNQAKKYIALDNSNNNAWVEEFDTQKQAISFLKGEM